MRTGKAFETVDAYIDTLEKAFKEAERLCGLHGLELRDVADEWKDEYKYLAWVCEQLENGGEGFRRRRGSCERECKDSDQGLNRYEALRLLNVPQFQCLIMRNQAYGSPFDKEVDLARKMIEAGLVPGTVAICACGGEMCPQCKQQGECLALEDAKAFNQHGVRYGFLPKVSDES